MHRALRLASRGQRQLSRVTTTSTAGMSLPVLASFTTASTATASPCSDLRTPLPGAYREPTEVWHNGSTAEEPTEVEAVKSEADLTGLLASAAPDSLVVVKFYAILCGASKAVEEPFKHTAAEFADIGGQSVTFADVCFDSNRKLCEKMGIRSVPHVQIFTGSTGKIADFSIAPQQYDTLTTLLADRRDSVRPGK